MPDNLATLKLRQQRGNILVNLNLFYPSPVKVRTLFNTVCIDPTYHRSLYEKDITFFLDVEYIEFVGTELVSGLDLFAKVIKLTATGKLVAEGNKKDPYVEI